MNYTSEAASVKSHTYRTNCTIQSRKEVVDMRKVRVLFSGLTDRSQVDAVLNVLHRHGEAQCQHVNFTTGHGTFVLLTESSHRAFEDALAAVSDSILTGVENLETEGCHDCQNMVT